MNDSETSSQLQLASNQSPLENPDVSMADTNPILPRAPEFSRLWLLVGWVVCGLVMFALLQNTPLTRTQEGRIVVSAREMVGEPFHHWMIPTANGEARLRKPPLAYWLSAISFEVFGYSTTAARIPALISAWLTVGLVFAIGKRLFNTRIGFYAAGCLLATWNFILFGLLAETDTLIMGQMTAGFYFLLRARDDQKPSKWVYLIGLMIALMALTKGPPAAYLILSILLVDWNDGRFKKSSGRPSLTLKLITTGAILIPIAIATPWFIYAFNNIEGGQLTDDLSNSALGGRGHSGHFWAYFPMLAQAFLFWIVIWLVSCVVILKLIIRKTISTSEFLLLIWGSAILIPLMVWGNKQPHYLITFLPPGVIAIGWIIDRCNRNEKPIDGMLAKIIVNGVLIFTLLLSVFAVFAIPLAGKKIRGSSNPADLQSGLWLGGIVLLVLVVGKLVKKWKLPEVSIISTCAMMLIAKSLWLPSLEQNTSKSIVEKLTGDFPDAHFVFRSAPSLPMCAAFQRIIPVMEDDQLRSSADDELVCIAATENSKLQLPGFTPIVTFSKGDEHAVVVSVKPGSKYARSEPKNAQP